MTVTTVLVLLGAVLTQAATAAQRTTVTMSTSVGEYYGTVYVPSPSGGVDYVLLRGQPFGVRVSVFNKGDEVEVRQQTNRSMPLNIRVTAVGSSKTIAEAVAGSPSRRGPGGDRPARLPATLARSEGLHWEVSIPGLQRLAPGRYQVKVDSGLDVGAGSAPLVNNDVVVIELRDVVSLAGRVEALRIAATRALRARDFAGTDAASRQLLAIHPQSAFAHLLIGDAAVGRRDTTAARAAYLRATELLRERGDTLYAAVATEHSIAETLGSVEAKVRGLGR